MIKSDPRVERTKKHNLLDLLVIGICSVLTDGDSFEDMHAFAEEKQSWLKNLIPMRGGVPSADTFERIFTRLNPKEFRVCFLNWTTALHEFTSGAIIAIDGKKMRHSFDKAREKNPIHMVSAWSNANGGMVLAQEVTENKSNEITAISNLLNLLSIKGCLITIDAIGCQKEIAKLSLKLKQIIA